MTHANAQCAIYIDFECLATKPPHPALLGVLVGAGAEEFEQVITDERLAPARVAARKTSRIATAADAVGEVVARAKAENRMLVGWSLFDRDRLVQARPDLEGEIKARDPERPEGRQAMAPDPLPRLRDRAGRPLRGDAHARQVRRVLAGYPDARHLHGAPARWIRHMLRQLQSTGGEYRRTDDADETRLAQAARLQPPRLPRAPAHRPQSQSRDGVWRAYKQTRFCVDDGPRRVCFRAGSNRPRLRALLLRHDALQWAFVTAWNPASVVLSRTENNARQLELRGAVDTAGFAMLTGEGVGEDPKWQPEESALILGISRGEAVKLGRRFGQLAIVAGRRGRSARLIPCGVTPRPRNSRR